MNNKFEQPDHEARGWESSDSSKELLKKEKRWEELGLEVDNITDRLGKKIDGGIKETVIGLNVFDIPTTQSCEGHEKWGTGGPYIDVESTGNKELDKKFHQLIESDDKSETGEEELDRVRSELKRNNLIERKKLAVLLQEFYQLRNSPFETRLIIRPYALGRSRLESQGVEFQEIEENIEEKKQRLKSFQEEMQAFQDFLKLKFFESE